jgi:hypothetical protein
MSKKEKLIDRLLSVPTDFTWDELVTLLSYFGYEELSTGKTGGSRRRFIDKNKHSIFLHKPHPSNIIKKIYLHGIINNLREKGKLKND